MKLKHILATAAVGVSMVLSSCSLNEDVKGFSTPDNFYLNKAQCTAALNSSYIGLKSIYTYQMMLATEAVTDLAWAASGTQDAQLDITPAKPRHGATVWAQCYKSIMYTNATIDGIERSPLSEEEKTEVLGEGKIMRAYYYYLLTSFFGDVPFYRTNVATPEIQLEIAHLPRMSAFETRKSLVEELLEIVPKMKQVRTCDIEGNRAGAAVGYMLIAKMSMWNKDWETALGAIAELEKIYGSLEQYPLSDIPFRQKNTPESIFEIQHTYTAGGVNYSSNVASVCMPYPRSAGKSTYDGVEIPELGNQATTWSPLRPTAFMAGSLMYTGSGDLRLPMTLCLLEYNGQKFKTSNAQWLGPKFWCPGQIATYDSNNYKIFRYADALLMKAECLCMLEQNSEEAVKYLNMTRARAGLAPYNFRNYTKLMLEIMNERGRELFGEFQRKFDLVRWGVWFERTYSFTSYTTLKDNILPCHEYYPIPDTEVTYSGYNLDNKAYKEYGL